MDNTNKTSLEEAKANFEEIKKFATEAAKKEFESEISQKIDRLIKESLSIEVNDDNTVTISTEEKPVELNNDEIEIEDELGSDNGEENFDDNEEIKIDNNIDEMMYEDEQGQIPAENPAAAPAPENIEEPAMEEPVAEEPPVDDDVMKLAQDIVNIINNAVEQKMGGNPSGEQGVEYIDDETSQGAEQPAPAPAPAAAPGQPISEELLEFSLEELAECGTMGEEMLEFELPEEGQQNPEEMMEIEIPESEDELDEMKGVSKTLRNTSNRLGLEPREGIPNLQESKKIKAQYESKIDELKKENKRLNESVKELGDVVKNYQDSFVDLRKQFDEMQTFNAKLAYANKIFASGGLSTSDKTRIAEEFDKTQNADEAKKLYARILEENKLPISKDNISKLKAPTTNAAPTTNVAATKGTIYESAEMKRRKILAGIDKNEDFA